MLLHGIESQEFILYIDAVRSQSFGKTSLSTHLGVDRCAPLYMKQTKYQCKFFRCFTLSVGMQARFINKFKEPNKKHRSKSQQKIWTPSAVFARVCYGRGQTTLGRSGFKDVRLEFGFCLFFQVRPSLQLEQATHTTLKA